MQNVTASGVVAVVPHWVEGVDFCLVDLSDGKGAQVCKVGTCEPIRGLDLAAIIAASAEEIKEHRKELQRAVRRVAYPNIGEYLDAQVKKASSDANVAAEGCKQEAAYFSACEEVKRLNKVEK